MTIRLTSVLVDNQEKALHFYTQVLGFVKKTDVPLGEHRWVTVVSAQEQEGPELLLEPLGFEPARTYQQALFEAGIPAAMFTVADLAAEYARLRALGVTFSLEPTQAGVTRLAVFADTCGNHLQLVQA